MIKHLNSGRETGAGCRGQANNIIKCGCRKADVHWRNNGSSSLSRGQGQQIRSMGREKAQQHSWASRPGGWEPGCLGVPPAHTEMSTVPSESWGEKRPALSPQRRDGQNSNDGIWKPKQEVIKASYRCRDAIRAVLMEVLGPGQRKQVLMQPDDSRPPCSFSSPALACKRVRCAFWRAGDGYVFTFGLDTIQWKYLINGPCVLRNKKWNRWR